MTGCTSRSVLNDMKPSALTLFTNDARNSDSGLTLCPGNSSLTDLQNLPDLTSSSVVLYHDPGFSHLCRNASRVQKPAL